MVARRNTYTVLISYHVESKARTRRRGLIDSFKIDAESEEKALEYTMDKLARESQVLQYNEVNRWNFDNMVIEIIR